MQRLKMFTCCSLLVALHAISAKATDIDNNGIDDDAEQAIVDNFCPSLVLDSRDLAGGDTPVCPEQVEIVTNAIYAEIWDYTQQNFYGDILWPWSSELFHDGNYSGVANPVGTGSVPGACGPGAPLEIAYFHFDFGGFGPGCTEPASASQYDQKYGWESVYKFGRKDAEGNWITRPASQFRATTYAHIYFKGYHPVTNDPVWVIQYWYFYPYDDWANDHEGDWEHINVHITGETAATATMYEAVYYFHRRFKVCPTPQTANPNGEFDCYVTDGTHPVIFVGGFAAKSFLGDYGEGNGSHGCFPVYGHWDEVVKEVGGVFSVNEHINGEGTFIPWHEFVDNDPDDRAGVVLIRKPDSYDYDQEEFKHLSWLKADILWGHRNVHSFASDYLISIGQEANAAPQGPAHQPTWETSAEEVGPFKFYNGHANEFHHSSDADWQPPYPIAIGSPAQGGSAYGKVSINGSVFYGTVSVEVGEGASPVSWSSDNITVSTTPVYGSTIATWNTGVVSPGQYTVRVRSTYGGQTFERSRTFNVYHRVATVDPVSGGDFAQIQLAVDWAQPGDTVRVFGSGQYYLTSTIEMKESVSLVAASGPQPDIFGPANQPTIAIADHEHPCVVEGLIIRHNWLPGFPTGSSSEWGVKIDNANPVFRNCTFAGNSASQGAGALVYGSSRPVFEDCRFEQNRAGSEGGAICIPQSSGLNTSVECRRCVFANNIACSNDVGAAVTLRYGEGAAVASLFENCDFIDNDVYNPTGDFDMATVFLRRGGETQFINCLFAGNATVDVVRLHLSSPIFDRCTVANNTGLDGFLGWLSAPTGVSVGRSIISNNAGPFSVGQSSLTSLIDLENSVVFANNDQGRGPTDAAWVAAGGNNRNMNPTFCNAGNSDYRLYASSPAAAGAEFDQRSGAFDIGCAPTADVSATSFSRGCPAGAACPQGTSLIDLTVSVHFTDPVVTRQVGADEITLDLHDLAAKVFEQDGTLSATGPAAGPGYATTIQHRGFGGCSLNDAAHVLVNGYALEEQLVSTVRTADLTGDGTVNLVDFSQFTSGSCCGGLAYPNSPNVANDCRNLNGDLFLNVVDFQLYAYHNGHSSPYSPANAPVTDVPLSDASVSLAITEEFPTATTHRLYVDVDVVDFADVSTALFAFNAGSDRLEFSEWQPAADPLGVVMFSPVDRVEGRQLYFGIGVSDAFSGNESRLGRMVFNVTDLEPFEVSEDNFVLVTGDVLEGPSGGNQAMARMSGVFDRSLQLAGQRIYHDDLEQNFPNPFNPTTTLAFSIKEAKNVNLSIYDVAGRRVRELVNEHRDRGAYKVVWDGQNDAGQIVASGVYFYKLIAGSFTDTKKMTILK